MNRITELLELTRLRQQMLLIRDGVRAMVAQDTERDLYDLGLDKKAQEAFDDFRERALNIITIDEMIEDMTVIYQRHFSPVDIEDFIAFYSSPAGQKFLDATPLIMQEYQPIVLERVKVRTDALKAEIDEFFKALDKK